MNHWLILPMAVYVLGLFLLGLYLFFCRVRSIKSGEVSIKYYRLYDGAPPSPKVLVIGQHFDNQFQVPMLFLITCGIFMSLNLTTGFTELLAWFFVLTRGAHSIVHLSSNNVRSRAAAYFLGWFAIMALWGQLVWISWP
jgi:hypothetical protein